MMQFISEWTSPNVEPRMSLSRDGNRWISSLASQLPQDLQATPPHSVGASLSRDGIRWIPSLASQLPQELQATPRALQERACLAMAFAGFHRWQASSHRICKRHPALCRSKLALRWQPLNPIAGKPAPTGATSDTPHSAGASLPRDCIRWIPSLASQLPQDLQATPRTLQERACLAMASAEFHRWQASSHRICKRRPALCRSELVSRWHSLNPIPGKPAPTGSASDTPHSAGASVPRDVIR